MLLYPAILNYSQGKDKCRGGTIHLQTEATQTHTQASSPQSHNGFLSGNITHEFLHLLLRD